MLVVVHEELVTIVREVTSWTQGIGYAPVELSNGAPRMARWQ